jgi:hypothetical protein
MATKSATFSDPIGDGSTALWTWALTGTDDGAPVQFAQWSDRSVQVGISGDTFGGGTVILEGSNDGATWTTIRSPDSTTLSFTAAGLKAILETTVYIRCRASVSVTAVSVILLTRRPNPMRT